MVAQPVGRQRGGAASPRRRSRRPTWCSTARAPRRGRAAGRRPGGAPQILERTSHLIEDNAEQIARIIAAEGGKPLKDARVEAKRGASTFRWASEEAKRTAGEIIEMDADAGGENRFGWTIREPRGVIAAISPFNFPLNLVAHKVAPALAGGNAVVLKPASTTPLTALRLAELLAEAGLPDDVLQVVVGSGAHAGQRSWSRTSASTW